MILVTMTIPMVTMIVVTMVVVITVIIRIAEPKPNRFPGNFVSIVDW